MLPSECVCVSLLSGVWGYDQHTVQVLQQMQQEALSITDNMTTDQDITDKVCM